ncbi:MAG: non-ribosomal peptide synthetase, partial [bacterium]|nr:non-ribosomal peptide synthetase [bacterium]
FEDIDISRTVGWFTALYPVRLVMDRWRDLAYAIKSVKETLRRVPNKGFGYGILKYLAPPGKKQGCTFNLEPQINFNYLGQFGHQDQGEPIKISHLHTGENINPQMERLYALDINGLVSEGKLIFSFIFNKYEYQRVTIEKLAGCFKSFLLDIIDFCINRDEKELTPSDMGYTDLEIDQLELFEDEFSD